MSEFPRQGALTSKRWSLARDNQLRTVLESLADAAGWNGVVSGMEVVDNGGVSVSIGAGSLLSNGVLHTEATATVYNGLPSDGTSYVFLRAARTAASQNTPSALDTYDLAVDDNLTGALPAEDAGWFPRAVVVTSGGDILSITHLNSTPPGRELPLGTTRVLPSQSFVIPPDTQRVIYGDFQIDGDLQLDGDLYLLELP